MVGWHHQDSMDMSLRKLWEMVEDRDASESYTTEGLANKKQSFTAPEFSKRRAQ